MAQARVGVSGWHYPPWRGSFYPPGLRQRDELAYAAQRLGTIEVNGSFYALQRPASYASWAAATPDGFVLSVKGGRFITHMKRLVDVEAPLANFFASGVLALGPRLGPVLWQLPPSLPFEPDRLAAFLELLPRTTAQAAALAARHDERLDGRALTTTDEDRSVRHAVEARHPSFASPAFVELLRRYQVALVVADSPGRWPSLADVTADFVYARLHGDTELYASGYTDAALDTWARRVRGWRAGEGDVGAPLLAPAPPPRPEGRDVLVYFDNDAKAHAPHDAMALAARVDSGAPA
ncbi:DUF72 domain-containing protein [Cellulomonas cellasea]|uniref:DUF72 domain-containing protein n=1 Tax=Cellulomonas cellasea TaxID=43670 RepID=UPI0025A3842A|nr:DUF72 domain-containing protein [Cellulomonas cellasea]MDM8083998.1 DUF72 domain-containing protein [Cellulomonas cellasea]